MKFASVFMSLMLLVGLESSAQAAVKGPIYNPETKSYFELRDDNVPGYWRNAKKRAESLVFKGVRGRLAVVNSRQVNDFLRRHFTIKVETWIGLRYWCGYHELQWVTGDLHPRKGFKNWAPRWYRNAVTKCGSGTATRKDSYMPVYYTPTDQGFRWQASGPAKGFKHYFVEYPTGAK